MQNESLNGNVFYLKSFQKYYKLTAESMRIESEFVLNRRLVNGNTQEFIQGIENVNHGTTWLLTQFKKIS
jgi:hypothetical protein